LEQLNIFTKRSADFPRLSDGKYSIIDVAEKIRQRWLKTNNGNSIVSCLLPWLQCGVQTHYFFFYVWVPEVGNIAATSNPPGLLPFFKRKTWESPRFKERLTSVGLLYQLSSAVLLKKKWQIYLVRPWASGTT